MEIILSDKVTKKDLQMMSERIQKQT